MRSILEHAAALRKHKNRGLRGELRLAVLEVVTNCLLLNEFRNCADILEALFAGDLAALKLELIEDDVCFSLGRQLEARGN